MTQHRISLSTAADTLAAIPALLGFTPENSVVVIAFAFGNGTHTIAFTMRVAAAITDAEAGQVAEAAARQQWDNSPVTAVILAAIADPAHTAVAMIGLEAIREAFAARSIDTLGALHAYSLTAGTMYTDLDHNTDGVVPDSAVSDVAIARAVVEGATIAGRREDIEARFDQAEEISESLALVAAATMGEQFLPVTFDELAAVIDAREMPSADLTARVGLALATGRLEVRDAFLAMAVHGHQDAADTFTYIAARVRGTARAQALTLAAFFLYCTGNGVAANVAIEAVESLAAAESTEVPSLAKLLSRALQDAMPPRLVATLSDVITDDFLTEHIGRVQSYT